ncbi:non-canonical purine NTP pyrophosphatase [Candidatus Micrarchaeota archaeon]|nr:non-canonical purine NTP pyrophosphatase [Candidatus Micrarchaeota archaeon]
MAVNLLFVTSNASKVREAKHALGPNWKVTHKNLDVPEVKTESMEETIQRKAETAFSLVKKPVLVEDTGFFLDAYPNFPGTYTKFCIKRIGLDGFLKLLEGKNRQAGFETWLGYHDGQNVRTFTGSVKGSVADKPRGKAAEKLPYDLIFIPQGEKRTYAEMPLAEKQETSHRAKAFAALKKAFP